MLLFKFGLQDFDDLLCLFQLQVGTRGDLLYGQFQHALGRVAADVLQGVDDPSVDLVGEFGEGHVLFFDLAVYVDV